jgi:transcriptional regulator GlxA family with amidase domain
MYNVNKIRLTLADMKGVELAIAYIDKNYRSKISAEQLSIEVNLPKEKLQAGFQKITSLTVHQYILQIRVEKAKDLLSFTNSPLKAIASVTGFNDKSHLCKVFKKYTSCSPIEYRFQQAV